VKARQHDNTTQAFTSGALRQKTKNEASTCHTELNGNGNLIVADCGNHCSAVINTVRNNEVAIPIQRHYARIGDARHTKSALGHHNSLCVSLMSPVFV
jgi:hypothetical protein